MILLLIFNISATQYTLKLGHADGVESRKSILTEYFAKLIEEDLGEEVVEIQHFPAGALARVYLKGRIPRACPWMNE